MSRRTTLTALLSAAALMLAACGSDEPPSAADGTELTPVTYITTATLPGSTQIALYAVPLQMGYFEEEGLDVTLETANGSTAALQVISTGGALATNAEVASTMAAVEQGLDVKTFGSINTSFPWRIGVPADSDISTPADLRGTKIGIISLASGSNLYTRSFLAENGIDPDSDVELIPVGTGSQAKAALDSGQVDSLAFYAELFAQLEQSGSEFRYLEQPALFDDMPSIAFTAQGSTLEGEDRDLLVRYARAAYKGLMFSAINPAAAAEMGIETFPQILGSGADQKTPADIEFLLKAWMTTSTPQSGDPEEWGPWGVLDETALQNAGEYALSTGQVAAVPPLSDYFDGSLIEEINDFDREALIKQATEYTTAD